MWCQPILGSRGSCPKCGRRWPVIWRSSRIHGIVCRKRCKNFRRLRIWIQENLPKTDNEVHLFCSNSKRSEAKPWKHSRRAWKLCLADCSGSYRWFFDKDLGFEFSEICFGLSLVLLIPASESIIDFWKRVQGHVSLLLPFQYGVFSYFTVSMHFDLKFLCAEFCVHCIVAYILHLEGKLILQPWAILKETPVFFYRSKHTGPCALMQQICLIFLCRTFFIWPQPLWKSMLSILLELTCLLIRRDLFAVTSFWFKSKNGALKICISIQHSQSLMIFSSHALFRIFI